VKTNELQYIQAGQYWSYIGQRAVYNCPLDKTNDVSWQKRAQRVSSYCMNGAVCGYGRLSNRSFKLNAFNPSAYVMWEPEIHNYGGTWAANSGFDASQKPNEEEGIGHRHKKGAIIGGFSGNVHFITYDEFQRQQKTVKPGLLWCAPDTKTGE
jgi:hypothetical protein